MQMVAVRILADNFKWWIERNHCLAESRDLEQRSTTSLFNRNGGGGEGGIYFLSYEKSTRKSREKTTENAAILTGSVTSWTRLACVVELNITSWANPFLLFVGEERNSNGCALRSSNSEEKQTNKTNKQTNKQKPQKYFCCKQPYNACKWKYLRIFDVFWSTSRFAWGPLQTRQTSVLHKYY